MLQGKYLFIFCIAFRVNSFICRRSIFHAFFTFLWSCFLKIVICTCSSSVLTWPKVKSVIIVKLLVDMKRILKYYILSYSYTTQINLDCLSLLFGVPSVVQEIGRYIVFLQNWNRRLAAQFLLLPNDILEALFEMKSDKNAILRTKVKEKVHLI